MPAANQIKECFKLVAGLVCVSLFVNAIIATERDMCRDRRATDVYSTASITSMLK
jgi:hypothetical protein